MANPSVWYIARDDVVGWDENAAHVIVADSAEEVRKMAARVACDEGEGPWFDTARSHVTLLAATASRSYRSSELVLTQFNAG